MLVLKWQKYYESYRRTINETNPLSLLNPRHTLNLLLTLLCHDKVRCFTRVLMDEPLPITSDLSFFSQPVENTSKPH